MYTARPGRFGKYATVSLRNRGGAQAARASVAEAQRLGQLEQADQGQPHAERHPEVCHPGAVRCELAGARYCRSAHSAVDPVRARPGPRDAGAAGRGDARGSFARDVVRAQLDLIRVSIALAEKERARPDAS
jgi:hypothetical protein